MGFLVGKRLPMSERYIRAVERHEQRRPKSVTELVYSAPDPLASIQAIAGQAYGWPGGHIGWDWLAATTSAPNPAAGCSSSDRPAPANPPG